MIDIDKYERHSKGWVLEYGDAVRLVYPDESSVTLDADQHLITDAPLLLAEVKRLREATQQIIGNIELWCNGNTVPKDILMEKLKEMIE